LFVAFVIYPIGYGLWMGSNPALYAELFSDPRYVDLHRAFDQEQPGVRRGEGPYRNGNASDSFTRCRMSDAGEPLQHTVTVNAGMI